MTGGGRILPFLGEGPRPRRSLRRARKRAGRGNPGALNLAVGGLAILAQVLRINWRGDQAQQVNPPTPVLRPFDFVKAQHDRGGKEEATPYLPLR